MEPTANLIPTKWKSKLYSTLSCPLGAQEISSALAGVPQFDDLELAFSNYWGTHGHQDSSRTLLFRAEYIKRDNFLSMSHSMIERGSLEPHWELTVGAVPRTHRKTLHDRMLLELPTVSAWLKANQSKQTLVVAR